MARRPSLLIHGDLHRENLIVDEDKALWTIDWELARIGDPLYELATHLHLMRYPEDQEREVIDRWKATVEAARKGATRGTDDDLPHYLAFKRVQSAHTDIMRAGLRLALLPDGSAELTEAAAEAAHVIASALKAVEGIGGGAKRTTPSMGEVESVLLSWRGEFGRGVAAQHHAMALESAPAVHVHHGNREFRGVWDRLVNRCESRCAEREVAEGGGEPVAADAEATPAPVLAAR